MTATLRLRDYQHEAIKALFQAWYGGMRRPALVLPTGAGKTVVFADLIRQWKERTGTRAMVLVHRDELADQALNKIRNAAPGLSLGKVKARDNDVRADVVVASVQTLARHSRRAVMLAAEQAAGPVGLIVTDECHHAAARSYQDIYADFPRSSHAGVTATLERGDGIGLGDTWDDVVFSRSILWMIKRGYLVQPRGYNEDLSGLDLGTVKRSRGDYQANDLGEALEEAGLSDAMPKMWKQYAEGRQTIVFTPTVATAESVAQSFELGHGIRSGVVSGATPREERLRIFDDFRTGRIRVLVNCMVLTEGFDAPWASCVIIARPTQSRPLYVQMVGRVLRPWHDKTDAIVINVNGAGGKLATLVDLEPGAVREVGEGEGLLDAEEREELEAVENSTKPRVTRPRSINLKEAASMFAASHTAWLETAAGVMFISAGEWTYFLWPNQDVPGTWDVCRRPNTTGRWEQTPHRALDAEMAMSWAEAEAEDHGSFHVGKNAAWRHGAPSRRMIDKATALGIRTHGLTRSEMADQISIVMESRALDPYLGRV